MKNEKSKLDTQKVSKVRKFFNLCNILMLAFFAFVLIFDLVTKYVVEDKLLEGESVNFIPGFIRFEFLRNPGAAWGLFSDGKFDWILIVMTFVFLLVFLWFFFTKKSKSKLLGIASGLILGGCVGNLYDRLFAFDGRVRDFIKFEFMNFPTFNIADAALCVGVFLLAIYFIFIYTKELKAEKAKLEEQGITDKDEKVFTDDLDKKDTKKFDLKAALTFKNFRAKRAEKKAQMANIEADKDNVQKDKKAEGEDGR